MYVRKKKGKYCILTLTCGIQNNGINYFICKAEIDTHIYNTNIGECENWKELEDSDLNIYTIDTKYKQIGSPRWLSGKQSGCNVGDTGEMGSIPGLGTIIPVFILYIVICIFFF